MEAVQALNRKRSKQGEYPKAGIASLRATARKLPLHGRTKGLIPKRMASPHNCETTLRTGTKLWRSVPRHRVMIHI